MLNGSLSDLFVPAITNTTSYLHWILSKIAASGEIKLGFISNLAPKDKFQTFTSGFEAIMRSIFFKILKELNLSPAATVKCLTLNRPHPSSKSGFKGTYGCPGCDNNDSSITSNTDGLDFPDTRYYDLYKYGTSNKTYNNRILGDATGEMGPVGEATYGSQTRQISSWYADEAWFVHFTNPWFLRGGQYSMGTGAGVFHFIDTHGDVWLDRGFRIILSI